MLLCSDPCAGIALRSVSGAVSVLDARSYGSSGNRSQQKRRDGQERTGGDPCAQVDAVTVLSHIWAGIRSIRSLFSEVVVFPEPFTQFQVAGALLAAITVIVPSNPIRAADVADITLRSGPQLKERLSQVMADRNGKAALDYFGNTKLYPEWDGLTEVRFRVLNTRDHFSMFFIPVAQRRESEDLDHRAPTVAARVPLPAPRHEADERPDPRRRGRVDVSSAEVPTEGLKHLVLVAEGPKRTLVLLGTIVTEAKPPEVKEESVVIDGKVRPGQSQLKSFFKCSVVGCVPAGAGCLLGGPSWLPCFCLWCGGSVVSCGLLELFFP
jgi:hypothetical protein